MQARIQFPCALILCAIVLTVSGCSGSAPTAPLAPAAPAEKAAPAAATPPATSAPVVCTDPAPGFTSIWVNKHTSTGDDPNFPAIADSITQGLGASGTNLTGTTVASDLSGLDQSMLVFYTGHGKADGPTDDNGTTVFTPANLKLGECAAGQDGKLRYLIVDSCNVFAHGPKCPSPFYADPVTGAPILDYVCPGNWDWDVDRDNKADKDTDTMRSIFDRWGFALGNNLRMVCGVSTLVDPWNATGIASAYGRGTPTPEPVADLIMSSLAQDAVALCLTVGGSNFADSSLVKDVEFTPAANAEDEDYYHLQYSKPFDDYTAIKLTLPVSEFDLKSGFDLENEPPFPACMPTLGVTGEEAPAPPVGSQNFDFSPAKSEKEYLADAKSSESAYVDSAWNIVTTWNDDANLNLPLPNLRDGEQYFAYGQRLMLFKMPVSPALWAKQEVTQKSVTIQFPRRIDLLEEAPEISAEVPSLSKDLESFYAAIGMNKNAVGGKALVNVLDNSIELQLNNDRSLIRLTSRWPPIKGLDLLETVPPIAAYYDALKQLGGGQEYRLASWNWGYGRFSPTEMRLYHRFNFVPDESNGFSGAKYPPRTVWTVGQTGNKCN